MNITEFLEARIREDELRARSLLANTQEGYDINEYAERMLAECAAKRAIIACSYFEPKDRPSDHELHLRSSHPAYEYRTTEGQRKRWDEADEPPEGEGWERNTDAGRDGWDRFEFTEESYWRRLKPEAERRDWKQYIPKELRALAAVYKDHPDYQEAWAVGG
jgi:hypothetical protein